MLKLFRATLVSFVLLTILTGLIYPLVITGIAQAFFPWQANGSLIGKNNLPATSSNPPIGSALIGQYFDQNGYFWSRPSATAPQPYNAEASSGSNLGPSNPALIDAVKARIAVLHAADPDNKAPIPVDLVTSSASGLDPDISIAAADYQMPRVAAARHLPHSAVRKLIARYTQYPGLGLLGDPCVNVLRLNLALDCLAKTSRSTDVAAEK